ncbi:succinylglutamate desuccinylase/aspartoacylase family protein [Komagataeibacter sp. FNDCF1]|uniref:succinylglutamate desuccinylase/aspartoacylase domain-containing protein n=1 Tax=Komagataeibacter sp. FNDCF1 TaxID=2878681 RepID=UPI001E505D8B|nr:succinylglutamate desuccinylase/aspartoacylase family protein [Komagataeibacter sp. FNDCF1]MCE2563889.1 succinylglutamate desuccinylase/aspartoacylase family protein [Komagataeibacter sp. FNDCF1]
MTCGPDNTPLPVRIARSTTFLDRLPPPPSRLPRWAIDIAPPDLSPWLGGNCGIPGVMHYEGRRPGPHVVCISLIHGNEFSGAIVLDRLLRARIRPRAGRLSLVFANPDAMALFDPRNPVRARCVDEDMNRIWSPDMLDGRQTSHELDRARELMPVIMTADRLLDLHSMLWPGDPLLLSGLSAAGRRMARRIRGVDVCVADRGHRGGCRLIDHPRFTDGTAAACLLEAGQHWQEATVTRTMQAVLSLIGPCCGLPGGSEGPLPRHDMVVTHVVTARTGTFRFVRPFHGGEILPRAGTVVAHDGHDEIRTPYARCMLVMPNLRPARGHTAVRFARADTDRGDTAPAP